MSVQSTFSVSYKIVSATKSDAEERAEQICIEQTVEMPKDALPQHALQFTGQLKSVEKFSDQNWLATIEFPVSIVGNSITQFLNVLFGNCSLYPGIQITGINFEALEHIFKGPSFGISGIRKLLDSKIRPLSCTALKPVGLETSELAERAYLFSSGGIDIIKDDHGLANQDSAPFRARIAACVRAVRKGEQISGKKTLYFPNITTSASQVFQRFEEAIELGADGVLLSPQLTGLEIMHDLAMKESKPIMAHPSFSGSFTVGGNQGILADMYYGLLWRHLGSDAVIYPNTGGRFAFSEERCTLINNELRRPKKQLKKSFPVPAGGIKRETISKWVKLYGVDTILLVGGSLYQHPQGIKQAARDFQQILLNR